MITTLSADLTTPVPEALVRQLQLQPGTQLDWQVDGSNQMIVHVAAAGDKAGLLRQLREMGRRYKKPGQDAVADLIRAREDEDQMRENVLK